MDAFYGRLTERTATIDELISEDFEPLQGRKGDADLAAQRLAAWCRSSANGDWTLFRRRLARDGLSFERVLERFATVRRKASVPPPAWIGDAVWIETALQSATPGKQAGRRTEPCVFEHLLLPVVGRAESLLWTDVGTRVADNFTEAARASLSLMLLNGLSDLCAAALYERFAKARAATAPDAVSPSRTSRYDQFVADMRGSGFRRLFE